MVAKKNLRSIDVNLLKIDFFVRAKQPTEEYQVSIGELYENNIVVDPILVAPSEREEGCYQIVDGRTRYMAQANWLGRKMVDCEIIEGKTEDELIVLGFLANTRCSKVADGSDLVHTLVLLLDRGIKRRTLVEEFAPAFNAEYVQKQLDKAAKRLADRKMAKALERFIAGESLENCSRIAGVPVAKFQAYVQRMTGSKDGHGKGGEGAAHIANCKSVVTQLATKMNASVGAMARRIAQNYSDGLTTKSQVEEFLAHVETTYSKSRKLAADWNKRFQTMFDNEVLDLKPAKPFIQEVSPAGIVYKVVDKRGKQPQP